MRPEGVGTQGAEGGGGSPAEGPGVGHPTSGRGLSGLAPPSATALASVLVVLLGLLLVSGVPLALVYLTATAQAHHAMEHIADGSLALARNVHAWAAHAVLAFALVHAVRAYVMGRVQLVGRLRGVLGVGALAVLFAAYFSGTILPWDQQGWEAYQHLGFGREAWGGPAPVAEPADAPIARIFWAHVLVLPGLLLLILRWHVPRRAVRAQMQRVAVLVRSHARLGAGVLLAVVVAALVWPPELGIAPLAGLALTRPDWPFLWLVPLQDWLGARALVLLPLSLLVWGALVASRRDVPEHWRPVVVLVVLLPLLMLTALGLW